MFGFLKDALFGKRMDPIQSRVVEKYLEGGQLILEVQCKGLFPIHSTINAGFMISTLIENNKGKLAPVLVPIEVFQEPKSSAFQNLTGIGEASNNQGYLEWTYIGMVPIEILQPTFGGDKEVSIVTRLVDMDSLPNIRLGFGKGALWTNIQKYNYIFEDKGYQEEAEDRDKARALSIEIGMAVAMSDGELHNNEGKVLNKWIKKIIAPFSDERQAELKKIYNNAMKKSYQLAESGDLVLGNICKQLNEIGEDAQKYEAIELAHQVMAADGFPHAEEMKVIHEVADTLGIDSDELENMRDRHIVTLDTTGVSGDLDIESLLNIGTSWGNDKILLHLRQEYQKWNNRLNTLLEGSERDNAQRMLDLIAKARKKYGG
jgi:tellurite resistance protein